MRNCPEAIPLTETASSYLLAVTNDPEEIIAMQKGGAIYIMTNKPNTVLYTGVTVDLARRVYQHKERLDLKCFTYKYNVNKLVYYESFHTIEEAIAREKQIKGGSRKKKEILINAFNPDWKDLWDDIQNW